MTLPACSCHTCGGRWGSAAPAGPAPRSGASSPAPARRAPPARPPPPPPPAAPRPAPAGLARPGGPAVAPPPLPLSAQHFGYCALCDGASVNSVNRPPSPAVLFFFWKRPPGLVSLNKQVTVSLLPWRVTCALDDEAGCCLHSFGARLRQRGWQYPLPPQAGRCCFTCQSSPTFCAEVLAQQQQPRVRAALVVHHAAQLGLVQSVPVEP